MVTKTRILNVGRFCLSMFYAISKDLTCRSCILMLLILTDKLSNCNEEVTNLVKTIGKLRETTGKFKNAKIYPRGNKVIQNN